MGAPPAELYTVRVQGGAAPPPYVPPAIFFRNEFAITITHFLYLLFVALATVITSVVFSNATVYCFVYVCYLFRLTHRQHRRIQHSSGTSLIGDAELGSQPQQTTLSAEKTLPRTTA